LDPRRSLQENAATICDEDRNRKKASVYASGTSDDLEPACNERLGQIRAADAIRITVLLQITPEHGPL
jgi:hypothetical protein